jgi:hypothetical protein
MRRPIGRPDRFGHSGDAEGLGRGPVSANEIRGGFACLPMLRETTAGGNPPTRSEGDVVGDPETRGATALLVVGP